MSFLKIENIYKSFATTKAVRGISFEVEKGKIFGLLGPNGAGKTTTIRMINNIYIPDSGQILFENTPINSLIQEKIGYLPEERGLYKKIKVIDQILYFAALKGMDKKTAEIKADKWLEQLDAASWRNKKVQELSKGMQQKVQFIATVVHQPELIILDEPFSGFDPINANLIKEEILELRKQGCTIIFSTHRMESVEELCDYIALINKSKKILEGKKMDIKNAEKQHIFSIETQEILDNSQKYHIIDAIPTLIGTHRQRVRILEGSPNEFLKEVLEKNQVVSFSEEIPSMNDIFIAKVGKA